MWIGVFAFFARSTVDLLRKVSFYDGPVEHEAHAQNEQQIFENRIEDWEQWVIDGSKNGGTNEEKRLLDTVRRDNTTNLDFRRSTRGLHGGQGPR